MKQTPEAWIAEKAGFDVHVGDDSPGNEYFQYGVKGAPAYDTVPAPPYDDDSIGKLVQLVARAGYDITIGPGTPTVVIVEAFVGEVAATCCASIACAHRDDIAESLRLALAELMTEEGEQ